MGAGSSSPITVSGSNVGIGTTSPAAVLDVKGTIYSELLSNALIIGALPASLTNEHAGQSQPSIIINGFAGGSSPNFSGNSIAIYDFRNASNSFTSGFAPPALYLGKSRSGTAGAPGGIVQTGDGLGGLFFVGDDGTNFESLGAYLGSQVDGTPSVVRHADRRLFLAA